MRICEFMIKCLLFAAGISGLCFFVIMPQYTGTYNAAIIDKLDRLKNIEEPKIILVGDSNVVYGFDSQKIQEEFNMPVVNFGLHGGLAQVFHTDMIKPYINSGDIVIIAPASYSYPHSQIGDPVLTWLTIENHFYMWKGIGSNSYVKLAESYPTYLRRAINLWIANRGNLMADRDKFNEYGDITVARTESKISADNYGSAFFVHSLSENMKNYWNDYNSFVNSKNATLYMSCPPIFSELLPDGSGIDDLQRQLEEELDFTVISKLQDYIFPIEYFYDTGYHLNDAGVSIRTKQVIADLEAVILR